MEHTDLIKNQSESDKIMKNLQKNPRARAHKAKLQKYTLGKFPQNESEWTSLADDMIAWAHQESSFAIEDFPLSKGYSPHKFYKWVKHNEYFADALEFARYMVGSRREKAAREKRADSTIILKTMPLYNYEFKELMMDKIRKHQEERTGNIMVVLENCPNGEQKEIARHPIK